MFIDIVGFGRDVQAAALRGRLSVHILEWNACESALSFGEFKDLPKANLRV